jgi:type IV secretory pathway VirB4 component
MNGSGKSYFLTRLEIETHCCFDRSYIIDYGGSHRPYSEAVGGKMLTLTLDCQWTINLFGEPGLPNCPSQRALITALAARTVGVTGNDDQSQDKLALLANHVAAVCAAFADAWLRRQTEAERLRLARHALVLHRLVAERMCEPVEAFISLRDDLNAGDATARQLLAAPTDAEVRLFATQHRDALRELAFAYLPVYPTLSSLREHLAMAGHKDEKCARLADRLQPWCRGGSYGTLFDGQSNINFNDQVTHLELGRLDSSAKDLQAVLWFLLLITIRQQCLRRPAYEIKRIVLEEIAQVLTIPGAEAIFREMLATFRKLNVQVNFVCQQAAQLETETLRRVILGNVRMAFIFYPGTPTDLDLISEHLPLSAAAKAMILRYVMPDQLSGTIYSECCYLHMTAREPLCGTIRFVPLAENENHS